MRRAIARPGFGALLDAAQWIKSTIIAIDPVGGPKC
jgi:hypothetical protein